MTHYPCVRGGLPCVKCQPGCLRDEIWVTPEWVAARNAEYMREQDEIFGLPGVFIDHEAPLPGYFQSIMGPAYYRPIDKASFAPTEAQLIFLERFHGKEDER